MSKTLLLIGGGHAHMTVMAELDAYTGQGHRVVLVNPDPYHYYSGMGPGMLGGTYRPQEVRFHVRRMVEDRGGEFVQGRVIGIDWRQRTALLDDGRSLAYDVASCNTGSGVPLPPGAEPERVTRVKPIVGLFTLRERLLRQMADGPVRLLVIGGGAAGAEVAGNLRQLATGADSQADITLATGRHGLLPAFPASLQKRARANLVGRGIRLIENRRVASLEDGVARLESGGAHRFDQAIVATGVRPGDLYRTSGLSVGEDGGLAVNACLQSVDAPELFGGGDCIHFLPRPLAKVGVYAVRQNPVLRHNLLAALEGRSLKTFTPQKDYLLILNLGEGDGLLKKGRVVVEGQRAFTVKNWIDRRFMRKFQLSGELEEGL